MVTNQTMGPESQSMKSGWWDRFFEHAPDALLIVSTSGHVEACNRLGKGLFGIEENDVAKKVHLSELMPTDVASLLEPRLSNPLPATKVYPSIPVGHGGNFNLMADIQLSGLSDTTTLITIKDISSRWRMESHVQRLMTALDCTPDMVFMTDTDFRIVFVNPAFHTNTGHTIEDALGQKADFLRAPGQETLIEQYTPKVMAGGDWTGELTNIHPDGHTFPVNASISPIYDRKGALLGFASFERDITGYKKLQKQLVSARDHVLSIINSLD